MYFLFLLLLSNAHADTLEAIRVDSSATESLQYDPVLPARSSRPTQSSGNGGLVRDFADRLALPVTDTGNPGGFSQFRGLGRTADETNVQTLGVPLNSAIGGGLDLSSLPQFLWSSYQFRSGPTQGGYDPRSTAGTLTLVPWTSYAIRKDSSQFRVSQLVARELLQSSVGASGGGFGALVGYSSDFSKGFSGTASVRVLRNSDSPLEVRAHVLATELKSKSPGQSNFPTPNDTQSARRILPVLELSTKNGISGVSPKLTLYYDGSRTLHEGSYKTEDHTEQFGFESSALYQTWRVGLSGRHVSYRQESGLQAPGENFFHAWTSPLIEVGDWIIQPEVQVDVMSRQPVYPGAALGARVPVASNSAVYARASFAPRFASLQDRYYQFPSFGPAFPGFQGNPDLTPERNYTLLLGNEFAPARFIFRTEVFAQFKEDVQLKAPLGTIPDVDTVKNVGIGRLIALTQSLRFEATSFLDVLNEFTLTHSRLSPGGAAFPYLAPLIDSLRLEAHDPDRSQWRAALIWRHLSDMKDQSAAHLGGYSLVNLEAGYAYRVFELSARVENVGDSHVEVTRYYPLLGRVLSVLVSAHF